MLGFVGGFLHSSSLQSILLEWENRKDYNANKVEVGFNTSIGKQTNKKCEKKHVVWRTFVTKLRCTLRHIKESKKKFRFYVEIKFIFLNDIISYFGNSMLDSPPEIITRTNLLQTVECIQEKSFLETFKCIFFTSIFS